MNIDYGTPYDDPRETAANQEGAREFLEFISLLKESPDRFRRKFGEMLFAERLIDRVYAGIILDGVAPLLGNDLAQALNAALLEEPNPIVASDPTNDEFMLAAMGVSTRSVACKVLGGMRTQAEPAVERLYELLDRSIACGPVHIASSRAAMGITAAELADTIAQIQGPVSAPRLLPVFEAVLVHSQEKGRDERILSSAIHGLGFLRREGRPLLYWLNWMDREKDPQVRFLVACAACRVRDGDHGFKSRTALPIRDFQAIFSQLMSTAADQTTMAEAAEVCAELHDSGVISPAELTAIRNRLAVLCEHPMPRVHIAARHASITLAR